MKKRLLSLCLAFALLLTVLLGAGGLTLSAFAADEITVKLHYHREDGIYDGWDVWFWPSNGDGAGYSFVEEDGDMVATCTVNTGVTSVGYIVRYGGDSWSAKDIDSDQFIDIAGEGLTAGTIHVYVESGVAGHTVVLGDDAKAGILVTSTHYDGDVTATVQLSKALDSYDLTTFTVTGSEGNAEITAIRDVGSLYYLTFSEPLDPFGSYKVIFEDTEYELDMPDFYGTERFESEYTYTGDDLGATYTKEATVLRVWAPTALSVTVNLYTNGDPDQQPDPVEQVAMEPDVNGTWVVTLEGDQNGVYYTYLVSFSDAVNEACDPYARTTGINGQRAMILDLDSTDPEGWENDTNPNADLTITDAVIYELHVRDLSSDSSSGIVNVGKYLGLIETGTTNSSGISTGLDHIKDLGITHLHLLPVYDFGSVDESGSGSLFNWGYDPVNYNVPEGSYSTDPYNGEVRVSEFKQMVQGLHENGISVVMDVVYNHVYNADSFCFNLIVPDYFSRPNSNGSGCGNDTASERSMVSKYIVDSVLYWVEEYHIDGFRFDLVGLLDTDTINAIIEAVHAVRPDVIFYGEGWTLSTNVTKSGYSLATQTNADEVPEFAFFNDTIRDLLKGSVFDTAVGYVSGKTGQESTLIQCFMGAASWCPSPTQTINYASCHDNNTLIDRITISTPNATRADQIKMNNLAAAIYLTSQGVPFMQAGEEMLRSKPNGDGTYNENSYSAGDEVNSLKWDNLSDSEYMDVYNYYKGLIAFRKAHSALRMSTAEEVSENITSVTGLDANVAAFQINGSADGDGCGDLFVIFNANNAETQVTLPSGSWDVYINGEKAGTEVLDTVSGTITVAPISAMVLVWSSAEAVSSGAQWGLFAGIAAAIVAAAAAVTAVVVTRKKK